MDLGNRKSEILLINLDTPDKNRKNEEEVKQVLAIKYSFSYFDVYYLLLKNLNFADKKGKVF